MLTLIALAAPALLLISVAAVAVRDDRRLLAILYYAAAGLCGATACLAIGAAVAGGDPLSMALPLGVPWIFAHLRLDGLSAFFLALVHAAATIAFAYAAGYVKVQHDVARAAPFMPIFVAAMSLTLLADDAFVFLVAWELMTLASWALVLASHREEDSRQAAHVYLVVGVFGALCLMMSFGLLAGSGGDYRFDTMRARDSSGAPLALAALFALIGAGSKAGLAPLHVWLPLAHPAAPAPASALMSGAMTKVAIYGLIRILFDLCGPLHWGWGAGLSLIGGVSAVVALVSALAQTDLKKALAYSTVDNIGVIALGVGLSLAFYGVGQPYGAGVAMIAALTHAFNHALLKTLMFCGAGAAQAATGTRNLEEMGGLAQRAPMLAWAMLAGAMGLSALPPLNGFMSEWLTFQAILALPGQSASLLRLLAPVEGALLALATALAAACFVRIFGIVFLGRPRSPGAAAATAPSLAMTIPLIAAAAVCLVLGLAPGLSISLAGPAAHAMLGDLPDNALRFGWLRLAPQAGGQSGYSGLAIGLTLAALGGLLWLVKITRSRKPATIDPPWGCGFNHDVGPASQYTASSFAQPLRRVFGSTLTQAREAVEMPEPGSTEPAKYALRWRDPAWDWGFVPPAKLVLWLGDKLNPLQFLTIQRYLTLAFVALVTLLCVVAAAT